MMLRKSSHDRRRGRLRRFAIVLIYWVVIALISPGFSQTESQPSNKTQAASQGRKTPLIPSEPPPTAGEAAAPNGERPKSLPTIEEAAEEETEEKEPEELPVEPEDLRIRRFGYDYFEGARRRILTLEATLQEEGLPLSSIKDAVSGFVGPVDMMKGNVNAIVPHSRVLRPGDRLTLIYWSEQSPLESRELVIDPQGRVILPEVGNLVARGMTLEQFERAAQELLSRKQFTDLKLIATLEEFHTIQIFITGYAFRPGGYAASAVTTLFNALYLCGGPSIDGAFRDIRLIRNGETTTVDFYKYLMDGDASQDVLLMAGDTIFIGPVGRLVTIEGEVKRPDTYELVPGENFSALLNMAGGLRPSGFAKVIQLESVSPNQERVLRELDASGENPPEAVLYDGDLVRVLPVLDEVRNVVYVEGNVYRPGTYEFTQGLTVGDLVMKAEGPLPEAHLPRVDLFRLNDDGRTTTLIPINLELALRGDEAHNVRLQQRDRLAVYSRWEVQWLAERVVSAQGAVPNPGSFERADEMRVSDLLLQAGGVLPEAHLQKAILFRLNANGQVAEGIEVNLEEALQKDPAADLLLQDGDALLVYRFDEVRWMPEREVAVSGAVQKPGTYPRLDNMRVSDLLFQSGGLLPEAATTGLLLRRNENWEVAESFIIDFTMAHKKQPEADLLLKDGDSLIAYTQDEKQWRPPREVSITGAVQTPGVYQRTDGMRVSDLLFQAGGVLPNAYLERANLQRYLADQESLETIPVNLVKATAGDAEADLMLRNRDALVVSTIREAAYQPNRVVTIFGAVQRPDTYMRTANMRVSDLLFVAGGVLPGARETIEVARARGDGQTTIITVSLMEIYKGNPTQDILLDDLDIVAVPRRQDFREVPLTVEINGLVKYPGAYAIEKDDRLSDLIARAGGLMPHAFPEGAIFTRKREKLIERAQEEALRRTWEEIEKEKQNEYLRRLARSRLSLQQPGVVEQLSSTVTSVVETAAEAPLAIVGALGEAGETTQANEAGGLEQQPEMLSAIDETAPQPQVIQSPTGTEINLVTPARKIEDLVPNQRIFVDLPAILKEPGGKEDILLEEGDAIDIPRVRETVLVSGAVIYAGPFLYQQGKTVQEYIDMAGGYARDADRKGVYVLKANGIAHQLNKVKHVDRGDIIVVPTQVMVEKVTNRWSQVVGIVRLVIVATTTIILIDRLTN